MQNGLFETYVICQNTRSIYNSIAFINAASYEFYWYFLHKMCDCIRYAREQAAIRTINLAIEEMLQIMSNTVYHIVHELERLYPTIDNVRIFDPVEFRNKTVDDVARLIEARDTLLDIKPKTIPQIRVIGQIVGQLKDIIDAYNDIRSLYEFKTYAATLACAVRFVSVGYSSSLIQITTRLVADVGRIVSI